MIETEQKILLSCFPNSIRGGIWNHKNIENSNLRNFLLSFTLTLNNITDYLKLKVIDLSLFNCSIDSIVLWENLCGIPDVLFFKDPKMLTLEERITQVAIKLFGLKISTKKEWVIILKKLFKELQDKEVYIYNANQMLKLPTALPFPLLSPIKAKNTIIVKIPESLIGSASLLNVSTLLPFKLGEESVKSKIEAVIRYLIPFNKDVIVIGY
jgi:hypothetical protein